MGSGNQQRKTDELGVYFKRIINKYMYKGKEVVKNGYKVSIMSM